MDFIQLLILQFIAHLLTDFFFQPDKKAKEKNDLGFKSKFLKWHILIAFGWCLHLFYSINLRLLVFLLRQNQYLDIKMTMC